MLELTLVGVAAGQLVGRGATLSICAPAGVPSACAARRQQDKGRAQRRSRQKQRSRADRHV